MTFSFKVLQSVLAALAVAGTSVCATSVGAQQPMDHGKMDHGKMAATKADQANDITEGVVRKVNTEAGKLTIQHGDIRHLGMPAMTMAFPVKTPGLLDNVQTGDKIKFKVIKENGRLVITELQRVK
ncbi:copper-binding protein [Rhodoferax sp.]|uniref:copper-binding protein n=1 Tax=Rhodoferax sp. TaxID=50421 RepID=UPI002774CB77|nr:copper-binding protein [Rhodoferax sp.]